MSSPFEMVSLAQLKIAATVLLLLVFWTWESWFPLRGFTLGRLAHAGRNLVLAVVNTVLLAVVFGLLIASVSSWTASNGLGLLGWLELADPWTTLTALLLLDAWTYLWHRANHGIPWLWRFHRVHHSDPHMDVTTATRFHLGEHLVSATLRLGLIPLLGLRLEQLLLYDTLLVAVTMFHHADIGLGRWERWLSWLIVTPRVHQVHHSMHYPERESNYSSILTVWDRLGRSWRWRADSKAIVFGVEDLADPRWETLPGLALMPFCKTPPKAHSRAIQQDSRDLVATH